MFENTINSQSMLPVGTVLHDTYRIDSYLSSGGFGNTYVVTHIAFNETYAVKEFFMRGVTQRDGNSTTVSVSNQEKVEEFNSQREKFKKEALRLRKLNNKHIVRVHDLFEENGTAYYVMDYIDGESLKERLARTKQPLSESEVNKILPQILDALNEVHSQNIWHLDLKPANIMLDKQGTVKLIDFGASKQFNVQKGGATTSTAVSYTNGYAPREQMEQSYEKFGPWTDFYALGATLYNLLSNQRPPLPTDIDDDLSKDKHLALPLPSVVSEKMKSLVLWLMKTNRQERPASVQEIQDFLNRTFSSDVKEEKKEEIKEEKKEDEGTIIGSSDESKSNGGKNTGIFFIVLILLFLIIGSISLWNNLQDNKENEEFVTEPASVSNEEAETSEVFYKKVELSQGKCFYSGKVNSKGIPNGMGVAVFDDGRYYKGPFVDGNMHGDDAYFTYEGDVFVGSFRNNKFSEGKYTVASTGETFEGTFSNGDPWHGEWRDKDGNLLETI